MSSSPDESDDVGSDGEKVQESRFGWMTLWHRSRWFAPAAVAIVLARLRFLFTPVTSDEGGYFAVARAWGRGARLYQDAWVDRPQGLMLVFRAFDAIGLGNPVGIRIMGLLACLMGSAACGYVASRVFGPRAAWSTALVVGLLVSLPQVEGFIGTSELLSSSFGALSLAVLVFAFWDRDRPVWWALLLAGAIGGVAVSMRQSDVDAVAAGGLLLLVCCCRKVWSTRDRLLAIPLLIVGFLIPIALLMIHAAATDWDSWWYALIGYRTGQRSALVNADWSRLKHTVRAIVPILIPAIAVGAAAVAMTIRRSQWRAALLVGAWALAALAVFFSGGQFFPHYWVILMFPLGTAIGGLIALLPPQRLRHGALVIALVLPVVFTIRAAAFSRAEAGPRLSNDKRLIASEHVASWFRNNRKEGENLLVLCASAAVYANIPTDPPYPYLWLALIPQVPGAQSDLEELMSSPSSPTFVAFFQDVSDCDLTGGVAAALDERYEEVVTVDKIPVYARRDRA